MAFLIKIELNFKWYAITVDRVLETENLERFELTAGGRRFRLQTNRPEALKKKRRAVWKILDGEVKTNNLQDAALAMTRIFDAIERYYNPIEEKNPHQRRKE